MSILFFMIFMIPLCFFNMFWLVQFMFFIMTFLFMVYYYSNSFIYMNISLSLGCDLLSWTLILLTLWVCSLMILASEKVFKLNNFSHLFLLVMVILTVSLFLAFSSMNLFLFYLFFEISLIPTLMLILGWGYQPERLEAGVYLLFYTLFVSLPMMVFIFYYFSKFYTLEFFLMTEDIDSLLFYICSIGVFLVKIPMFFVHLWLPKAHVEAPVSGSMILAGIMLKLGGYGLLRMLKVFLSIGSKVNFVFIVISLLGGFIISLICIRQSDIKSLIAYSSVSHMGLALAGLMTLNIWGLWGALVMMLAHGLCSSGLFSLANISYERLGSRSLYINKGLLNLMPGLSFWWFLLCSSNMAAPPSLNLLGEIVLINSLVSFSVTSMLFLSLMSFFSAVYSLFLFSYSQHGEYYSNYYPFYQGLIREYLLLFLHWIPLNLLVLKGESLTLWI
uniref:NADH-ubiquinone oxidoreductase chain 4 n=1 Tax=Xystrocera globosa TaxID=1191653 RepID=A0A5J6EFJ5_9CUCU|nr:NADH dehydrogenase subunit 4 [Xystrocera globosa]QEU57265.1 NADH dehydrogenase subunit 4 [Xystrocera globosa]